MREFEKDGKQYIEISAEEKQRCFSMIRGEASPSDFGYDFSEAAKLIHLFVLIFKKDLATKGEPEEFHEMNEKFLAQADDLIRKLWEAGRVSGEDRASDSPSYN